MPWLSYSASVQEEGSLAVESSPRALADSSKVLGLWQNASSTFISMLGAYVLAMCIASLHLGLYTYLDDRKIDTDPTLQQSCVSLVALILVNMFRLAMCFCLAIAFTQIMWRRTRLAPMSIADFDRLPQLLNDLSFLSRCSTLRIVPALSIIAALGWLVAITMIFPPGSLTVVSKEYLPEIERRVPTFDSSFVGNGTYMGGYEYLLGTQDRWMYTSTRQSLLAIAKGTLISRNVAASTSPCGQNCTFTTSFMGPLFKCHSTTFNETVNLDLAIEHQYRPSIYSSGWTTNYGTGAEEDIATFHGWRWPQDEHPFSCGPSESTQYGHGQMCRGHSFPDTFFVSEHTAPHSSLLTGGLNATYERSTRMKTCSLHRATYVLQTQYTEGNRILNVSATRQQTLEELWTADQDRLVPSNLSSPIPPKFMPTYEVLNLFAVFDSLVQALSGEYYTSNIIALNNSGQASIQPADACYDELHANSTIIADSTFNLARFDFEPSYTAEPLAYPTLNLDLSEDRLNEALQNITLSAMYTFKWWYTTANVTTTTYRNIFSFSSRPRLVIPYVVSLLLTLPFLIMGVRAMQLNGVPASDPGFIQTLVSTAGSARLRAVATRGSEELGKARIRYGSVLDEQGVAREGFGLEDEVVSEKAGNT
ncbi:hypothetical protein BDU57DRAFT_105750 [Ampelomyces quisqualis]|uniref:Uncharacterized protein n=1 Tax=Ampelomyces quisqualis TaxID=50730 RepID=A0A6A5Q7I8_AMPQU|nr:hypothetical protein BDU57DRAFT_105750 [Ampelomyces quisqualis]